jgi:hypothetical protein
MSAFQHVSVSVFKSQVSSLDLCRLYQLTTDDFLISAFSISAFQYFSLSACQHVSVSVFQPFSMSAFQHVSVSVFSFVVSACQHFSFLLSKFLI